MKVWKITNKPKKIVFDNNYDYLIDINNKFGEEKKHYDYLFLFIEEQNIEKITTKIIFDNFKFEKNINESTEEKSNNFNKSNISEIFNKNELVLMSTHMDKIEEFRFNKNDEYNQESNKSKKLYTVICKCINFDNIIKKSIEQFDEENGSFSDLEKSFNYFVEKDSLNNIENMESCLLEITNSTKDKSIFLTKNKTVFVPEYLIEYNYSFNNININLNSLSKSDSKFTKSNKQVNIYNSSYFNKDINSFLLKEEYILNFNNSLRNLLNCEIKNFIPCDITENYSSCKFQFLDELNTTELFFSKNTILNFLHTCHKYSNAESFNEEFNKILEKLDEIKNLNFKNPFISVNSLKKSNNIQKSKEIDFLNNCNTNENNNGQKDYYPKNEIDLSSNIDNNNISMSKSYGQKIKNEFQKNDSNSV